MLMSQFDVATITVDFTYNIRRIEHWYELYIIVVLRKIRQNVFLKSLIAF